MSEHTAQESSDKRRSTNRTVGLLLAVAVLLLAGAIYIAYSTFRSINADTRWVEHTLEVEAGISSLAAFNERIETARRGYIIQPDSDFAEVMADARRSFDQEVAHLIGVTSDNPRQTRALREVTALQDARDRQIEQLLAGQGTGLRASGPISFEQDRGVVLTRQLREIIRRMASEEQRLLAIRSKSQLDSIVQLYWVGGAALALLILILSTVIVLVLRYNQDLARARKQLQAANLGLEKAVAARTIELTRANDEIQRFAYIVSHDLRSPLVNVLGFTSELEQARKTLHAYFAKLSTERPELRDEGAWLAVEEDLPEALGFIRSSTERMDRLINSILELSRQGRRPINPELLDMTELVGNVADGMHQRAEAAGATVTVASVPPLESDRNAVEQIPLNLVENAIKYLSPARRGVRIEGQRKGRSVEITVTDNGRGIAPADHERIFELFRRAGTQDRPGEGIGLANVRALAYRLGGRIAVESQLDQGARFTLILPEKLSASEPT